MPTAVDQEKVGVRGWGRGRDLYCAILAMNRELCLRGLIPGSPRGDREESGALLYLIYQYRGLLQSIWITHIVKASSTHLVAWLHTLLKIGLFLFLRREELSSFRLNTVGENAYYGSFGQMHLLKLVLAR